MQIFSIVPRLAPAIDGVGDYALNLAEQLQQAFAIKTHFIVGDPDWHGESSLNGFPVSPVEARSMEALLALLQADSAPSTILLHYVPHGYAKKACPFWLIRGLQIWKQQKPNASLVTMFHELYALGVPWSSDFWLSPVQKKLAIQLAQLTDRCLTSCESYATLLHQFGQGKHGQIPLLSVPSNLGEPIDVPPLTQRQPKLVVFGQTGARARVYKKVKQLSQICHTLGIQEILDIGPPTGLTLDQLVHVPIVELGFQSSTSASNLLLNSVAGLVDYDPYRLAKSGIFAAYCAHGLLPINTQISRQPQNGLIPGLHYWSPALEPPTLDSQSLDSHSRAMPIAPFQPIAEHAWNWYQTHNRAMQATMFADFIKASFIRVS
ncbi:MAG: hypothetical protein ACAF41_04420 [Leptolyngbya sp. BL-A-14]